MDLIESLHMLRFMPSMNYSCFFLCTVRLVLVLYMSLYYCDRFAYAVVVCGLDHVGVYVSKVLLLSIVSMSVLSYRGLFVPYMLIFRVNNSEFCLAMIL